MNNDPIISLGRLLPCLLVACAGLSWPATAGGETLLGIEFDGNRVTRERIMRQELTLAPGDVIDEADIARSRQALLNLGLFKDVEVERELTPDGVSLRYIVDEKLFLLPEPQVDYTSEGEFRYGMRLRWDNVAGRNQRLNLRYKVAEPGRADQSDTREWSFGWRYPLVGGSLWDVAAGASDEMTRLSDPRLGGLRDDVENRRRRVEVDALRALQDRASVRGWRLGGGLLWQRETFGGELADDSPGNALAVVLLAEYDDRDLLIYSETGHRASWRWEFAPEALGDFGYVRQILEYAYFRALGWREHQTLQLRFQLGSYHDGRAFRREFSLGGDNDLRGFDSSSFEGDAFYSGRIEWLTPFTSRSRSLRGLLFFDVGNIFPDSSDVHFNNALSDIGFGIRWRVKFFVDLDLELGIAFPLTGEDRRIFYGNT